ncbi:SRPBCC family protein [uncultured Corynebacterium sp.]|uniref:SRPBCC family protein n=1 Tax=uncultured Corynebacterium sp. TaxID=159447 RepID=UPI0026064D26|nr:SRPBCC family protein [uncultured Corynebacterium sp.]
MAAPEISASTTVNAPASKVWQRVTDLSAMGQRSPQCKKMILLPRRKSSAAGAGNVGASASAGVSAVGAAPAPGTVTINFNRQGILWWPTWAVVTEVVPEKVFEFKIPLNGTRWRFELTPAADDSQPAPTADGSQTVLTEKRLAPGGKTSLISRVLVAVVLGGEEKFEASLQEGIQQTIRALAREAENF